MNTRYKLLLLTVMIWTSSITNAQNIMSAQYKLYANDEKLHTVNVAVTIGNELQITSGKHQIVVNGVRAFDMDSSYVFDERFLVLRYSARVGVGIAERYSILLNVLQDTLQVPLHVLHSYRAMYDGDTQEYYSAKLSIMKHKKGGYVANVIQEHRYKDSGSSSFSCKGGKLSLDYSTEHHVFMAKMQQVEESREMYDPKLDRYVNGNAIAGGYPYFELCGRHYVYTPNGWLYITSSQVVKMYYTQRL